MGCQAHKAEHPVTVSNEFRNVTPQPWAQGPTLLPGGGVASDAKDRAAGAEAGLGLGAKTLAEIDLRLQTPRDQVSPGSQSTSTNLKSEATTSISEDTSIPWTERSSFSRQDFPTFDAEESHPGRLWILVPCRPALEGQYDLVEDVLVNGESTWRQAEGSGRLFSCSAGRWCIAETEDQVERNAGLLRTVDPHYSRLPHECSRWMYREDWGGWAHDAKGQILVARDRARVERRLRKRQELEAKNAVAIGRRTLRAPPTLWVASPPRPAFQGAYRREEGRQVHGYPVWKQVNGNCWLFSNEKENWVVCSGAPRIVDKAQSQLRTVATHHGRMPHEALSWKYTANDGAWVSDSAKSVRVIADREEALAVLANYDCDNLD